MRCEPHGSAEEPERNSLLTQVLHSIARRLAVGEVVDDAEVVAAHPALMPELGEQLGALRRVEQARTRATTNEVRSEEEETAASGTWPITIPGCELTQEVFRGGQAVVYKAFHPATGRHVAVKVLRNAPFHEPSDRARLQREVRILAQLQHPNIVSVHDSGTSMGCHYFVMDYIEGQALDTFMSTSEATVPETLRLLIKICNAVNAAHLRGVIHRDLKPSNIRVDDRGEPHVLDFGLAKMTTDQVNEPSQWRNMTITGQFVGSLPWASPEQAAGPSGQIDLRTDVYSLGVILYQMLTGRLPTPQTGSVPQMLTHILESEPVPPSELRAGLDEDVDTIVLKCLAKEPERRYQSAIALAEDVERYIEHRPILARAPSTIYHLRKLIRRHKLPFFLLAILGVSSLGFAVGMSALYARARTAEVGEAQRRIEAEREAQTAQAIKRFLVEDLLTSVRPENALGRKVTVEEILANASQRIDSAFQERPEIEASIRSTLGQVYQSLGQYDAAARHFAAAVDTLEALHGASDEMVLRATLDLVTATTNAGRLRKAEMLAGNALAASRQLLGADEELTLDIAVETARVYFLNGRHDDARVLLSDCLEQCRQRFGDEDARTKVIQSRLANVGLSGSDRRAANEQLQRAALAEAQRQFGDEHPETFAAMVDLGTTLCIQRRLGKAERFLRKGFAGLTRVSGSDHPRTIRAMRNLALLLRTQDRVDESRALTAQTVAAARRVLGPSHPDTLEEMLYLATDLLRESDYADVVGVCTSVLEISEHTGLQKRQVSARALGLLGYAWLKLGRYAEAEARSRQALAVERLIKARPNVSYAWYLELLVAALGAQGSADEGRVFSEEALELRAAAASGPDPDAYALNCHARALLTVLPEGLRDPQTALSLALLGMERSPESYHYNRYTVARAYEAVGNEDAAIKFARQALNQAPLEHSSERAEYEVLLVRILERTGDTDAAEQVYRDTLAARREAFPEGHLDIAISLFELGDLVNRHEKHDEAEQYLCECLDWREAALADPEREPYRLSLECNTAHTLIALGRSLIGQRRTSEAEPRFLQAYERLADNEYCHADLLPAVVRELVALYRIRHQPERARYYERLLSKDVGE